MPPKKPITSADLASVVLSAATGARQALAKGDLNGASVAMLTLSMAVANPSVGGAASGAHVPAASAAKAVPAAAEVLAVALDRAAAVESGGGEGEGVVRGSGESGNDNKADALRSAVEAASISAGCLSALRFVINESAEEEKGSSSSKKTKGLKGKSSEQSEEEEEDLEPLAALSRRLLDKIGAEFSKGGEGGGGGGGGGGQDGKSSGSSSENNPWTAKGALNNAASFAAALLEGFYGRRVEEDDEEGEKLGAAAAAKEKEKEKEREQKEEDELVVVSPQALTFILDAAATEQKKQSEDIRLLAVDLACVVASSSAALGEKLARWRRGEGEGEGEGDGEGDGEVEKGEGKSSSSSTSVVAALSRLLGSLPASSSDFVEVRVRNLMALAMTMSAELRLDERREAKAKEQREEKKKKEPSSLLTPGASARAALLSAPGCPAALVSAMKQSQDMDAKAVARGLFEEVARAEDSKAEMVAALGRDGAERKVGGLSLA